MAKKVLLIDADGKIPNLALMKLSTYHKAKGDKVGFNTGDPDIIYASIIYRKNRDKLNGIKYFYPNAEINFGGPGYNYAIKLDPKIEFLKPDYDLYPNQSYSMGFTTRGCSRKCYFCIVWKKEGEHRRWQHPEQFHDERFDTIMLLDNNWLVDKEWFMKTSKWILDHDLKVWEHGLDIRLVDPEIASRLRELRMIKGYHFAWDNVDDESVIREKIKLLEEYGFNLRSEVQFYVYVDDDDDFFTGLYRCWVLKELNTNPFIMFNMDAKRTQRIKDLQRWTNRKELFWSCNFFDYAKPCKIY